MSRVCGRHPLILDALATGQISLTVAGKLAPHLKIGNCERLIADCTSMTKREVEEYLVHLAPKPKVSPGARQRQATSSSSASAKGGSIEPCQPEVYNLRFSADKAFMEKLQRAAQVSGVGDAGRNMARVLEHALEVYLEKKDPRKRQERRQKKRTAQRAAQRALVDSQVGAEAKVGTITAGAAAGDD
ncbi:MAG: hypothetical protein GY953_02200, partial [bacterium]|nr:hypothetical protein [bacterium]